MFIAINQRPKNIIETGKCMYFSGQTKSQICISLLNCSSDLGVKGPSARLEGYLQIVGMGCAGPSGEAHHLVSLRLHILLFNLLFKSPGLVYQVVHIYHVNKNYHL